MAPALSLSVMVPSSGAWGDGRPVCLTVTKQLVPGNWSQRFLFASQWGPTQSLWGPVPGEADRPTWPCGASAAFCSSRAYCVCRRAHRWPCVPDAPHSLRVYLLCSLENATNSADAASSKFVFGQNMSERVLVSDPVEMILGAQRLPEPPAGHRGTWGVPAVTLECFLLPSKRKKIQLRLSLNSVRGQEGQTWRPREALREPGLHFLSLLISGQVGQLAARALSCVLLGPPQATSDARGGWPHPDCEATARSGWWGCHPRTGPHSVPCTHNTYLGSSSGPGWASRIVTCFLIFSFYSPNHTFPPSLYPFVRVAQVLVGAHLTPGTLISVLIMLRNSLLLFLSIGSVLFRLQ